MAVAFHKVQVKGAAFELSESGSSQPRVACREVGGARAVGGPVLCEYDVRQKARRLPGLLKRGGSWCMETSVGTN